MKLTAIAKSLVVVFVVVAAAAGATYALFDDTATIGDSTFATGSADLQIAENDNLFTYADSILGFSASGMVPGESTSLGFWLNNNSEFSMTVNAELTGSEVSLGDYVKVKFDCDAGNDGSFDASTGFFTVNQWIGGSAALPSIDADTQPDTGTGTDEYRCFMIAELDSSAPSSVANDSMTFGALFTGTQSL